VVKISVIVPVYNMEEYLKRCLDSLLNQTLQELEIIAVDDGSTDSSPDILREYSAKSSKLKVLRKENGGLSDARNYGFLHSTGEYIGYVDSDDYVDPEMYEVMYNKAKEYNSDIVECNLHHTYGNNTEDTEIMKRYYTPRELLCHGRHIVWNKIYLRSWLAKTHIQFPTGLIYEDVSFFLKIVPHISSYDYVDITPIHYVQRSGSVNNDSKKTTQIFEILKGVLDYYRESGFYSQYEQELEYMYARILLCSSFVRMCRIKNRVLRSEALTANLNELVENFPCWRENPILKNGKGRHAFFMRSVNKFTYKVYSLILPVVLRLYRRFSSKWQ